jgi:hypothetical protein
MKDIELEMISHNDGGQIVHDKNTKDNNFDLQWFPKTNNGITINNINSDFSGF